MIRLEDTSGGAIASAIAAERRRQGSPTTGMVLTLLVLTEEGGQADATEAAIGAAREHPMRIITLIPRPGDDADRIDASVTVGGDNGPGEVAVVRLRGGRAAYANSVVVPLLLSDTPVVCWWPGAAPAHLADDLIGRHATRRFADAAADADPLAALQVRRRTYLPGDTDLAWTRLTQWRSALAAAVDRGFGDPVAAAVEAPEANPSAALLAGWLRTSLRIDVQCRRSDGPGITRVELIGSQATIELHRPDGTTALLRRTGSPDATLTLRRRTLSDLVAEELRRLDSDEIYASALAGVRP